MTHTLAGQAQEALRGSSATACWHASLGCLCWWQRQGLLALRLGLVAGHSFTSFVGLVVIHGFVGLFIAYDSSAPGMDAAPCAPGSVTGLGRWVAQERDLVCC